MVDRIGHIIVLLMMQLQQIDYYITNSIILLFWIDFRWFILWCIECQRKINLCPNLIAFSVDRYWHSTNFVFDYRSCKNWLLLDFNNWTPFSSHAIVLLNHRPSIINQQRVTVHFIPLFKTEKINSNNSIKKRATH